MFFSYVAQLLYKHNCVYAHNVYITKVNKKKIAFERKVVFFLIKKGRQLTTFV